MSVYVCVCVSDRRDRRDGCKGRPRGGRAGESARLQDRSYVSVQNEEGGTQYKHQAEHLYESAAPRQTDVLPPECLIWTGHGTEQLHPGHPAVGVWTENLGLDRWGMAAGVSGRNRRRGAEAGAEETASDSSRARHEPGDKPVVMLRQRRQAGSSASACASEPCLPCLPCLPCGSCESCESCEP